MKKLSFILVAMLLIASSLFANTEEAPNYYRTNSYNGKTFNYVNDNVHFQVYQDGEFDFFIAHDGFTANFDFGAVNITYNSGYNYDAYVQYDDYGAIVQIENTPIYYDYYGRVSRIGNTHIHYRNRRIVRFGGLYVRFNSYGYFDHCTGYINSFNRHYIYRPYYNYYARPHFDYCVVSYRPYRQYYKPTRRYFDRVNRYRRIDSRRRVAVNSQRASRARKAVPQRVTRTTRNTTVRNSNTRVATTRNTRTVKPSTTRSSTIRNTRTVKPSTTRRSTRTVKPRSSQIKRNSSKSSRSGATKRASSSRSLRKR